MTLWLRVRSVPLAIGLAVLSLLSLATPIPSAVAAPSPGGATLALACAVSLTVPILVGWGCQRGDRLLEAVSTRSIQALDLGYAVLAVGVTALIATAMHELGVAPAGLIAARASLTYLGLMLFARAIGGWRLATLLPATYLVAVALIGRGEDAAHPAGWAFIAAEGEDVASWVLTALAVLGGLLATVVAPVRRASLGRSEP